METVVTNIDLIVSKSDAEGNITYVNPIFIKISGYAHGELLGKPHSILRHPDMPKVIFKYLWENLQKNNDVVAYVKNLCKNGNYYWVLATVKTAKNPDGSFRNHMSTRRCITENAKEIISKLYKELLHVEKSEGVEKSQEIFENFLTQNNIKRVEDFNAFMQNLNK
jgi:PAS domain S-box-containing protein